jgi:hypothetical protein
MTFLHSESNISLLFLCGTGCSIVAATFPGILAVLAAARHGNGDLTASASYKLKLERPRTQAKLIMHQAAIKSADGNVRAKIAQQINVIGKCKLLVDSQIFNWLNKACFSEKLLLGSSGSKKLATSESSFTKNNRHSTTDIPGRKPSSCHHSQNLFIVKIYTSFT